MEDEAALIIDPGTGYMKMGLSSWNTYPKKLARRGLLSLTWDDTQTKAPLWSTPLSSWSGFTDEVLKAEMELLLPATVEHMGESGYTVRRPLVLAESETSTSKRRAKIAQILFEEWGVSSLYMAHESAFSLYWHGFGTGVVVDCGHQLSSAVCIPPSRRCANRVLVYGGYNNTVKLLHNIENAGFKELDDPCLQTSEEIEQLKKELIDVNVVDDRKEKPASTEEDDGLIDVSSLTETIFRYGIDRSVIASNIFDPKFGIHKAVRDAIAETGTDMANLCKHIVLCGGYTYTKKFVTKIEALLKEELRKLYPEFEVKVTAKPDREFSVWLGAQAVTRLDTFYDQQMLSMKRYMEDGEKSLIFSLDLLTPR